LDVAFEEGVRGADVDDDEIGFFVEFGKTQGVRGDGGGSGGGVGGIEG